MQFAIDFVKERTGREVPALWGALLQRAVAEPMPHGAAYVRQLLQSATGFVDPLGARVSTIMISWGACRQSVVDKAFC
eukprot:COSAG01_NODE_13619_length_1557_cov_17.990398_2_plen_78_part_00